MRTIIFCILFISVFTALTISSMLRHSGTCDEIAHHIPSGVIALAKGDLKADTSQPPLSRYIIAAPVVLFLQPILPNDSKEWRKEDRSEFGRDFFFKYNDNSRQMLLLGRTAVLFIGVLLALLIFIWARQLYGLPSAVFALFLYCFSPDILAHSGLATTDLINMFFIFLSCYTFWFFICKPNTLNLFLSGASLGLAQLSKYSAVILYFIFVVLFLIAINKREDNKKIAFWKIFLIFAVSVVVIWAGYGFSIEPLLENTMRSNGKLQLITSQAQKIMPFLNNNLIDKFRSFLINYPIPLGEYVVGILGVIRHGQAGHVTYFMGEWSTHGNILYFLTAFFIKTPIPMLLFLVLGIIVSSRKKFSINEYFIFIPLLAYFIFASFSNLQIGVRHLFPIYPFCFVIGAQSIYLWRYKIFKFVIPLLCAWYLFISFSVWPNYLSYFNEFAGGANNGWKYLRDSNIDWGQDLPALKKYMEKEDIDKIKLLYFGEDNPQVYGITVSEISTGEKAKPLKEVYAISVQYLDNVSWAKEYKPAQKAGYSIFVYDFRKLNV